MSDAPYPATSIQLIPGLEERIWQWQLMNNPSRHEDIIRGAMTLDVGNPGCSTTNTSSHVNNGFNSSTPNPISSEASGNTCTDNAVVPRSRRIYSTTPRPPILRLPTYSPDVTLGHPNQQELGTTVLNSIETFERRSAFVPPVTSITQPLHKLLRPSSFLGLPTDPSPLGILASAYVGINATQNYCYPVPPLPLLPPSIGSTSVPTTTIGVATSQGGVSRGGPHRLTDEELQQRRKFRCDYPGCDRRYTKRSHLKAHTEVHKGRKRFKCKFPECDLTFFRSDELSRHHRKHTGARPFKCETCGSSFGRSDHLSVHKRRHQNERARECKRQSEANQCHTAGPMPSYGFGHLINSSQFPSHPQIDTSTDLRKLSGSKELPLSLVPAKWNTCPISKGEAGIRKIRSVSELDLSSFGSLF